MGRLQREGRRSVLVVTAVFCLLACGDDDGGPGPQQDPGPQEEPGPQDQPGPDDEPGPEGEPGPEELDVGPDDG